MIRRRKIKPIHHQLNKVMVWKMFPTCPIWQLGPFHTDDLSWLLPDIKMGGKNKSERAGKGLKTSISTSVAEHSPLTFSASSTSIPQSCQQRFLKIPFPTFPVVAARDLQPYEGLSCLYSPCRKYSCSLCRLILQRQGGSERWERGSRGWLIPSALALRHEQLASILKVGSRPMHSQPDPVTESSLAASCTAPADCGCLKSPGRPGWPRLEWLQWPEPKVLVSKLNYVQQTKFTPFNCFGAAYVFNLRKITLGSRSILHFWHQRFERDKDEISATATQVDIFLLFTITLGWWCLSWLQVISRDRNPKHTSTYSLSPDALLMPGCKSDPEKELFMVRSFNPERKRHHSLTARTLAVVGVLCHVTTCSSTTWT